MADPTGMEGLRKVLAQVNSIPKLPAAVEHVDKIIELLSTAREQVAGGWFHPITISPVVEVFVHLLTTLGSTGSAHNKFDHDEASESNKSRIRHGKRGPSEGVLGIQESRKSAGQGMVDSSSQAISPGLCFSRWCFCRTSPL